MRILLSFFLILFSGTAFAESACPPSQERIGPAEIRRECDAKTGMVTQEEWRVDGKLSRENGPARVSVKGDAVEQEWYLNGEAHPDPGPSLVHYDPETKFVDREEWLKNGNPHREDHPAIIYYDPSTGKVVKEEWYLNGKQQKAPE